MPVNLARSASFCVQTPTGQVFDWHWRTMMQPIAISAAVPMPYSSAPIIAAITISRPGPQAAIGAQRHPFAQVVHRQNLMRLGQAHFPWQTGIFDAGRRARPPCRRCGPEIRITSALAFATPAAIVPTPLDDTSFTVTLARGLICFRS